MWKDFLSSIGIGSVKVDTRLEKKAYVQGEAIKGEVLIKGGIAEEQIESIAITMFLRYESVRPDSDFTFHDKDLDELVIPLTDEIDSNEEKRIPFTLQLDKKHPATSEKYQTFLRTTLLIPQAIDSSDEDEIIVRTVKEIDA
ncbi:MAG TPA: sporulation protein [Chondromyces sp.]|nr:sporulation protein [Chondromyces sp.]